MEMKLGRLPRAYSHDIPHMTRMIGPRAVLPPVPPAINWAKGMPADLGMMLNDQLGDCTCAAFMHAIQVWSHATGEMVTEPDTDVLALYEGACGYVDGDSSTDQGGVEQSVLAYLLGTGAPTGADGKTRHKLSAFFEVDVRKPEDVRRVIAECGVCYIGFNVPTYLMQDGPPQVWDVKPEEDNDIEGGHAVILVGYAGDHFFVVSWGRVYQMTSAFFAQFVDEAYALVDANWINAKEMTPLGLTLAQLEEQMAAIKGVSQKAKAPAPKPASEPAKEVKAAPEQPVD